MKFLVRIVYDLREYWTKAMEGEFLGIKVLTRPANDLESKFKYILVYRYTLILNIKYECRLWRPRVDDEQGTLKEINLFNAYFLLMIKTSILIS